MTEDVLIRFREADLYSEGDAPDYIVCLDSKKVEQFLLQEIKRAKEEGKREALMKKCDCPFHYKNFTHDDCDASCGCKGERK